jgi:hypothetical protein
MLKFTVFLTQFVMMSLLSTSGLASTQIGSRFKKVILVIFENSGYLNSLNQKDFSNFSKNGATLTNLTAEAHPSLGNYVALVAGSSFGITSDNNLDLKNNHLGDLLEKAGKNWRVYAEDYPGNCFLGPTSGLYVRKHNPFISFLNVSQNPTRCQKNESADRFDADLKGHNLPEFSLYIPNMKNNGHNTGVDFAGKFLTTQFGSFLSPQTANGDVLLIVTFDESSKGGPNQVLTILLGSSVAQGSKNNQNLDHTSLLKLIEEEFSLGNLGQGDAKAPSINGIWK